MEFEDFEIIRCALYGLHPMVWDRPEDGKALEDLNRQQHPEFATKTDRLVRAYLLDPSMSIIEKLNKCGFDDIEWESEQDAENYARRIWNVLSGNQPWPPDEVKNAPSSKK